MKTRRNKDVSVADLDSLLLQISFAIMIIFMMAYFLFRAEARKKQEEQQLEVERQKLVIAVDAVNSEYRSRYGLDTLMPSNTAFEASALIQSGSLAQDPELRSAISRTAANGTADFSDALSLRRTWLAKVFEKSQLEESAITRESADWLYSTADASIASFETDIKAVEYASVAELQRFWMANPKAIKDPRVSALIEKFNAADENGRLLIVTDLSNALRSYAFEVLASQIGAPFLQ